MSDESHSPDGEVIPYEDFKLGLTFEQVRQELAHEQRQKRAEGLYMFVTRKTVLGRMCQYKREMYEHYMEHVRRPQQQKGEAA